MMVRHYDEAIRQGDVIMIPVTLDDAGDVTPIVAADGTPRRGFCHRGERGDHAHLIEDAIPVLHARTSTDLLYLASDAVLQHVPLRARADAPHAPIPMPAGYWEPRIQRVWSAGRRFRFAD